MHKYSLCFFFILLLPVMSLAQQSGEDEDDPFRRDPLFNKSLRELMGDEAQPDSSGQPQQEVSTQRRVRELQRDGLDFDGGLGAGPYHANPLYNQYPNLSMIHYNRVNGLFLGLKKSRMQWHDYWPILGLPGLRTHGMIGYGTASQRWDYAIGAERYFGPKNRFMVGGEYHRAAGTEDYWRVGLIESSLSAFFAAYDFPDYHLKEGYGFYAALRGRRWYEAAISFNEDQFSSLEAGTNYSMFGKSGVFRPNQPIDPTTDETDIRRMSVALSLNPRQLVMTRYFSAAATLEIEIADNNSFDNDFEYRKHTAEAIFFSNIDRGAVLQWRLRAGSITGEAPLFKQFQLGGIGTLRGSPYKVFMGNQMLLSNLELQFGRIVGNGSDWVDLSSLYTTLFLDSGYARQSDDLSSSISPFQDTNGFSLSDLQHDVGLGVGGDLFRAELAWPLKRFGDTPALWIRFNPTF